MMVFDLRMRPSALSAWSARHAQFCPGADLTAPGHVTHRFNARFFVH